MDFRLIKPNKIFDNFRQSETFIIPCIVLEIGEKSDSAKRKILIERLDFKTGKLIKHDAITYEKSVQIFDDMSLKVPFISECKILKNSFSLEFEFIVYGIFNASGLINSVTGNLWSKTDLELNERELTEKFEKNYADLNYWLTL